ncbi:major capsid protein [Bosea sp. (in: a-proteobacteria)]|uniref:major capsid protein n=1 Tax=Bosea sp. (in: a-proteobacteria) TaxID=1871050 RepID=UPI00273600A4|nr:major capsid protein [Bosea sp. (in: a-proteobacteria)]MDP3408077.1 major capsid protein [Bosea sp. (in: a-proteobacteria)]
MTGNAHTRDPFSPVAMTNAINDMDFVSSGMSRLFQWGEEYIPTTGVSMDMVQGSVQILPVTPRNGEPTPVKREARQNIAVEIPGYSQIDGIKNTDILGKRETGSESLVTLEQERNRRLRYMGQNIIQTRDKARVKTLDGIVDDGFGNTYLDLFQLFGQQQIEIEMDVSAAGFNFNEEVVGLMEIAEDELGAIEPDRYTFLTGRNANANLRRLDQVAEAATNPANLIVQRQDNRKGVRINEMVDLVGYGRAKDQNGDLFMETDVGYFVPTGQDFFTTFYGPSDIREFMGQPREFYAKIKDMDFDKGEKILVESFMLNIAKRPRAILKIRFVGLTDHAPVLV